MILTRLLEPKYDYVIDYQQDHYYDHRYYVIDCDLYNQYMFTINFSTSL